METPSNGLCFATFVEDPHTSWEVCIQKLLVIFSTWSRPVTWFLHEECWGSVGCVFTLSRLLLQHLRRLLYSSLFLSMSSNELLHQFYTNLYKIIAEVGGKNVLSDPIYFTRQLERVLECLRDQLSGFFHHFKSIYSPVSSNLLQTMHLNLVQSVFLGFLCKICDSIEILIIQNVLMIQLQLVYTIYINQLEQDYFGF